MKRSFLYMLVVFGLMACVIQKPETSKEVTSVPSGDRPLAKFEPSESKVLIFIGQDNESVGGNNRFSDGYVDHIGVPAGITHYIGLDSLDEDGHLPGLDVEADWHAGPMSLKYYLDSPLLQEAVVHLSIAMVGVEDKVARGEHDDVIKHIAEFLKKYPHHPYLIRIGYEFDGSWNHYEAEHFKGAWKRVVDVLKAEGVPDFATVFGSSTPGLAYETWEAYYPGVDYVDWVGYSYFWTPPDTMKLHGLDFARANQHPVLMAECAPRGKFIGQDSAETLWSEWFGPVFEHIEKNQDVIKGFAYINCNWQSQVMWQNSSLVWGDTRVQMDSTIHARWDAKMSLPMYINQEDDVLNLLNFAP